MTMIQQGDSARWAGQMWGVPIPRLEATESRQHQIWSKQGLSIFFLTLTCGQARRAVAGLRPVEATEQEVLCSPEMNRIEASGTWSGFPTMFHSLVENTWRRVYPLMSLGVRSQTPRIGWSCI